MPRGAFILRTLSSDPCLYLSLSPENVVHWAKHKLHGVCRLWDTAAALHSLVSTSHRLRSGGCGKEGTLVYQSICHCFSSFIPKSSFLLITSHSFYHHLPSRRSLWACSVHFPGSGGWGMGAAGVTWSWDGPEPPPAPSEAVPAITLFVSRKAV